MSDHKTLVDIAYRWVLRKCACGVAFKEMYSATGEYADVIGFGSPPHSVLIECKASRADFLADMQKPFRKEPHLGMGGYRFYCTPAGLVNTNDLPERWGLIWVDKGRVVYVFNPFSDRNKEPYSHKSKYVHLCRTLMHDKHDTNERQVMYSALRRLQLKGVIDPHIHKDTSLTPNQQDT